MQSLTKQEKWLDAFNLSKKALALAAVDETEITYSLTIEQINSLRDIALRIFDHKSNSVEDALALMKIALSHRPHGPLIKNKVEQWAALLKSTVNE